MRDHYVPFKTALDQLRRREALRPVVETWWEKRGWPIPDFLPPPDRPSGFLLRHVATARFEDVVFLLMARAAGLEPLWGEYTRDTFAASSSFKRSLVNRTVTNGRNRHGHAQTRNDRLVRDVNKLHKTRLSDITLTDGQPLVAFHHALQDRLLPEPARRFDSSDTFRRAGFQSAKDYYVFCLSWFVAHGVLFDDFHGGESGDKLDGFVLNTVEPAWEEVRRTFDVGPLIVALPWWKELAFYPTSNSWQDHRMIPPEFLQTLGLTG